MIAHYQEKTSATSATVVMWHIWSSETTRSGRLLSGYRIWPKCSPGFGKKQNILTGFGIGVITIFAAILTSRQRHRRRGYQFPYILCKNFANEADASDQEGGGVFIVFDCFLVTDSSLPVCHLAFGTVEVFCSFEP